MYLVCLRRILLISLLLSAAGLCGLAIAALKTDPARSSIIATFRQLNVPVDGKFRSFKAQIDFNAAKPDASRASMEIDIGSFDLGDAEYNKEVLKKPWFDAARYPKASFCNDNN